MTHEQCVQLIPWFVNDSLQESERTLVERHLRECLPCRSILKQEQNTHDLLLKRPESASSSEQGLERLLSRLDSDEHSRGARPGFRPRLAYVAAVVGLVAVGLGTVYILKDGFPTTDSPEYRTLSDEPVSPGVRIDVIFADGMGEDEIRKFAANLKGTIVAGPSEIGRYTIKLKDSGLKDTDLSALLDELRNDPRVQFAGRSYIDTGETRSDEP